MCVLSVESLSVDVTFIPISVLKIYNKENVIETSYILRKSINEHLYGKRKFYLPVHVMCF